MSGARSAQTVKASLKLNPPSCIRQGPEGSSVSNCLRTKKTIPLALREDNYFSSSVSPRREDKTPFIVRAGNLHISLFVPLKSSRYIRVIIIVNSSYFRLLRLKKLPPEPLSLSSSHPPLRFSRPSSIAIARASHPSPVRSAASSCPRPWGQKFPSNLNMVRTPFALFDTAPILGVRKPFLNLPSISTQSPAWASSPYPYVGKRSRYAHQMKSISALETSFSPTRTIEALRHHRWSGMPFPSLPPFHTSFLCPSR